MSGQEVVRLCSRSRRSTTSHPSTRHAVCQAAWNNNDRQPCRKMATITVRGRNTASCRRFAAETNTRNSTIPRYRPCFPYRRSTSHSARAAADWSPDASPSGPARHKHVPRPFENKTTQHAHKSRKVNHFRVNRRSIAYVAHSVNIRHMQLENTLHIAGMQQNTLRIHLTENTTGTFILTPIGSYQSVPGDRG